MQVLCTEPGGHGLMCKAVRNTIGRSKYDVLIRILRNNRMKNSYTFLTSRPYVRFQVLRCQTIDLDQTKTMNQTKIDSDKKWRSYAHSKTDNTIKVFKNGLHLLKFLHMYNFTSKGMYKQLRPSTTFRNKNDNFLTAAHF